MDVFKVLLGVIVGAFATGWVTCHYTKKHALELERKQKINLAKALRAELLSLWKIYMSYSEEILKEIDSSSEDVLPDIGLLESRQNYFVVFDKASNLLGLLKPEISQKVVET